jgi:hypothetical protein
MILKPKHKANLRKWVKLLRTTKRKQTTGYLRRDNGYCCLGIACIAMGVKGTKRNPIDGCYLFDGREDSMPHSVV